MVMSNENLTTYATEHIEQARYHAQELSEDVSNITVTRVTENGNHNTTTNIQTNHELVGYCRAMSERADEYEVVIITYNE